MSLDYAILGFLNYHPYSGYDLKKIFDVSVRHFWPADQSQIYRTLTRLAEQGFAEIEVVPQEDRPDRKVYHITESGRAELVRWLAGPSPMEEVRSPSLVQVFFLAQLSDQEVLAKFEDLAATLRGVLARYEAVPQVVEPFRREINSPRDYFFWMLTLEQGLGAARSALEWAESVIARIRSGQVPDR